MNLSDMPDIEQGSDAWKKLRCGKVTASRVCDVLARIKSGEAAARRDYRAQLVAERLTGVPQDSTFLNDEMRHGTETEPFARSAYEIAMDVLVDQVPFVLHPTILNSGASPDGISGDGVIEIKAPKTATHLQYLLDGVVPEKYKPQMNWVMACTGAAWCDFVSFDPRLPAEFQLFHTRFPRDDKRIAEMEVEVLAFLADVDAMLARLRG